MTWSLAEAKSKLSEVLNETESRGPQRITRRGKTFILIQETTYLEEVGQNPSFVDFLMSGDAPSTAEQRPPSLMRDIQL
ncbi:MAG: type II toxin-antitoxin system prevent-host-death family antitoxin [Akkermansiaceae bacterium]|nr:type II toxin-antitoxin system prevent-host-death family antitoxin [Akkermansiaceae bacterium]